MDAETSGAAIELIESAENSGADVLRDRRWAGAAFLIEVRCRIRLRIFKAELR